VFSSIRKTATHDEAFNLLVHHEIYSNKVSSAMDDTARCMWGIAPMHMRVATIRYALVSLSMCVKVGGVCLARHAVLFSF
jgi:hypothetical protein